MSILIERPAPVIRIEALEKNNSFGIDTLGQERLPQRSQGILQLSANPKRNGGCHGWLPANQ